MMTRGLIHRVARLQYQLFDRMRHSEAFRIAGRPPTASAFDALRGHHYCLLVTFRRSGEPVPTPMLFGMRDGKVYLRTDATTAKVDRIRNNPQVLLGPSNSRGKPCGPLAPGTARLVSLEETDAAYEALKQNYTAVQGLGESMIDLLPIQMAYIEVVPGENPNGTHLFMGRLQPRQRRHLHAGNP